VKEAIAALLERHYIPGEWDALRAESDAMCAARGDDPQVQMLCVRVAMMQSRDRDARILLEAAADAHHSHASHAPLHALLAGVREHDGELDAAISAARRCIALDANFMHASGLDSLLHLRDALDAVLVRGYSDRAAGRGGAMFVGTHGAGFWSEAQHLLGQVLAAEIDGRDVHVRWSERCLYSDGPDDDAWPRLFQPDVPQISLEAVERAAVHGVWPPLDPAEAATVAAAQAPGALDLVHRPHPVVVARRFSGVHLARLALAPEHPWTGLATTAIQRRLAARWLVPHPDLVARADAWIRTAVGETPFFAVHLRGTDKGLEQSEHLRIINRELLRTVDQWLERDRGCRVFLMTDDTRVLEEATARLGKRVFTTPAMRGSNDSLGVHFEQRGAARALGEEMLIDTLIGLRAERFAGNRWSNVACMMRVLRDWPEGSLALRGTRDASCFWMADVPPAVRGASGVG
jgi:hypothetical protein